MLNRILSVLFALAMVFTIVSQAEAKKKPTPIPAAAADFNAALIPAMDFATAEEALRFLEQCGETQATAGKTFDGLKTDREKKAVEVQAASGNLTTATQTLSADQRDQLADLNLSAKIDARMAARKKKIEGGQAEWADKNMAFRKVVREDADLQIAMAAARSESSRQYFFASMAAPKALFLAQALPPEEKAKVEAKVKELQSKLVDPSTLVVPTSVSGGGLVTPAPTSGSPTATPNPVAPAPATATPLQTAAVTPAPSAAATPAPAAPSVPAAPPVTLDALPEKYFGFTADALVVKGYQALVRYRQVIITSTSGPQGTLPNGWAQVTVSSVFGQYYIVFPSPPVQSKQGDAFVFRLK